MSEPQYLRVKTIEVKGLFGRYHHKVKLKLDDRVTILHGPNGVGKTVLLRMVNFLIGDAPQSLSRIPFENITVNFTDGSRLGMTGGERPRLDFLRPGTATAAEPQLAEHLAPVGTWEFRDQLRCHLIEAQRLLRLDAGKEKEEEPIATEPAPQLIHRVEDCARHLEKFIRMIMSLYGRTTQALDQSYPQRVLSQKGRALSAEILTQRLLELDAKQAAYMEVGLLDRMHSQPLDGAACAGLQPAELLALTLHVQDMGDKLSVLDYLARRIKLLLDHVNWKFRHKRIRIDREKGFVVEDDKGKPLELHALSSGEQHQLVLHYDLLFMVPPNTLVLIDEPELSLYVSWQKRFLSDLLEIVQIAGFDVLLATHSPYIIGDRADLMVALDDAG